MADDLVSSVVSSIPAAKARVEETVKDYDTSRADLGKAKVESEAADKLAATQTEELKKSHPDALTPPKFKEAPVYEPRGPMEAFGTSAGLMAVLGGMIGRRSVTHALNAATAAMQGMKQGDQEAFKTNYERWKDETDNMITAHKFEREAYQDALTEIRQGKADGWAKLKAAADSFQNAGIQQAAAIKDKSMLETHMDSWEMQRSNLEETKKQVAAQVQDEQDRHAKAQEEMKNAAEKNAALKALQEARQSGDPEKIKAAQQNMIDVEAKTTPSLLTSMVKAGVGGTGTPISTDAAELEAANRLFNGKYPPWMRSNEDRNRLDNDAAALAKNLGLTMTEAAALPAEKKADASALLADVKWLDGISRGQRVLDGSLDIAEDYMKRLPLTEIQRVNGGIVSGMTEFGSSDSNNYANAMTDVALEWGRLKAGPQSAAMLPVEVIKLGMGRLSNITPDQFAGEKELIKKDSANAIAAQNGVVADRRAALRGADTSANEKKSTPKTSGSHSVGDLIVQDGKTYVVTSVDSSGKVTGAKESGSERDEGVY